MAPVRCLNCGIVVLRFQRHAIDDVALNRHRNILRVWIPDVVFDQDNKENPFPCSPDLKFMHEVFFSHRALLFSHLPEISKYSKATTIREYNKKQIGSGCNILCHKCFLILDAIPENSTGIPDRSFGYATTCLGCGLSLNRRRNRPVHENINEIIRAWPDVPRFAVATRVCLKCWLKAKRHAEKCAGKVSPPIPESPAHLSMNLVDFSNFTCRTCCEIMRRRLVNVTCLGCGMGLANYYGDEIALQQRGVSKHSQSQSIVNDTVSPASGGEGGGGRGGEGACVADGSDVGTHGRRARVSSAEQSVKAAISPQGTLLCNDCYKNGKGMHQSQKSLSCSKKAFKRVVLSEKLANATVSTPPTSNVLAAPQETITLPDYKRVPDRTDGCLFPNCPVKSFYIIPQYVKQCLLRDYKLYTPEHSRVCKEHLISKNWKSVFEIAQSDFTAQQIEDVISILATNVTRLNFDNIEEVPRNLLLYCTGIDHRQFKNILDKIPSLMRKTKHPVLALIAYLTILKTNYCFDRLSTLFDIKPLILEELTDIAKKCMLTELVPRNARATLSSAKTKKVSEVLLEDDHILRYLEEHYYADGAMHSRVETVITSEPNQCRKRKYSSESDEDLLVSKAGPKKPLMEERVETNESIEISEVDVKFESPEGVEARVVSERDEEPEKLRVKEESDDEGEAAEDGETGDRHLVYVPKPAEQLPADPLDTIVVPAPLLEPVKSEDPDTEPEGGDSQAQPTASTLHPSRPFSVYYMKGATNFIRDPGPKFVLELPR